LVISDSLCKDSEPSAFAPCGATADRGSNSSKKRIDLVGQRKHKYISHAFSRVGKRWGHTSLLCDDVNERGLHDRSGRALVQRHAASGESRGERSFPSRYWRNRKQGYCSLARRGVKDFSRYPAPVVLLCILNGVSAPVRGFAAASHLRPRSPERVRWVTFSWNALIGRRMENLCKGKRSKIPGDE
jgi:hypothetical protein